MASASAVTNDDVRTAIDIKEEENRVAKEIELYFDIKRYLTLLNKEASIEEAKLYVISSGFFCRLNKYIFVVYPAKQWKRFLLDSFAKYVEEKYQEKLNGWSIPCEYNVFVVVPDLLYCYEFLIESRHTKVMPLKMYYHDAKETYF